MEWPVLLDVAIKENMLDLASSWDVYTEAFECHLLFHVTPQTELAWKSQKRWKFHMLLPIDLLDVARCDPYVLTQQPPLSQHGRWGASFLQCYLVHAHPKTSESREQPETAKRWGSLGKLLFKALLGWWVGDWKGSFLKIHQVLHMAFFQPNQSSISKWKRFPAGCCQGTPGHLQWQPYWPSLRLGAWANCLQSIDGLSVNWSLCQPVAPGESNKIQLLRFSKKDFRQSRPATHKPSIGFMVRRDCIFRRPSGQLNWSHCNRWSGMPFWNANIICGSSLGKKKKKKKLPVVCALQESIKRSMSRPENRVRRVILDLGRAQQPLIAGIPMTSASEFWTHSLLTLGSTLWAFSGGASSEASALVLSDERSCHLRKNDKDQAQSTSRSLTTVS